MKESPSSNRPASGEPDASAAQPSRRNFLKQAVAGVSNREKACYNA